MKDRIKSAFRSVSAAWNRLLGRKPPPTDGGPTVTPSFGGRSR